MKYVFFILFFILSLNGYSKPLQTQSLEDRIDYADQACRRFLEKGEPQVALSIIDVDKKLHLNSKEGIKLQSFENNVKKESEIVSKISHPLLNEPILTSLLFPFKLRPSYHDRMKKSNNALKLLSDHFKKIKPLTLNKVTLVKYSSCFTNRIIIYSDNKRALDLYSIKNGKAAAGLSLFDGYGVCREYADLLHFILLEMGINQNLVVHSKTHAFNAVKLKIGENPLRWYFIDPTNEFIPAFYRYDLNK